MCLSLSYRFWKSVVNEKIDKFSGSGWDLCYFSMLDKVYKSYGSGYKIVTNFNVLPLDFGKNSRGSSVGDYYKCIVNKDTVGSKVAGFDVDISKLVKVGFRGKEDTSRLNVDNFDVLFVGFNDGNNVGNVYGKYDLIFNPNKFNQGLCLVAHNNALGGFINGGIVFITKFIKTLVNSSDMVNVHNFEDLSDLVVNKYKSLKSLQDNKYSNKYQQQKVKDYGIKGSEYERSMAVECFYLDGSQQIYECSNICEASIEELLSIITESEVIGFRLNISKGENKMVNERVLSDKSKEKLPDSVFAYIDKDTGERLYPIIDKKHAVAAFAYFLKNLDSYKKDWGMGKVKEVAKKIVSMAKKFDVESEDSRITELL